MSYPISYDARIPDAIMLASLPDWCKMIWVAVRSVQGADRSCDEDAARIAERVGKTRDQFYQAKRRLLKEGFLIETERGLRCTVPVGDALFDVVSGEYHPFRRDESVTKSEQVSDGKGRKSEHHSDESEQGSDVVATRSEQGSEKSEHHSDPPYNPPIRKNQQTNVRGARAHEASPTDDDPESDAVDASLRRTLTNRYGEAGVSAAFLAYFAVYPTTWPHVFQVEMMARRVTDLARWQKALEFWAGNGHQAKNVYNILRYYDELAEPGGPPGQVKGSQARAPDATAGRLRSPDDADLEPTPDWIKQL